MTTSEGSASLSPLPAPPRLAVVAETSTPSFVGPSVADREEELDWRRVLGAIARFKWLILAVTLGGGMAGAAATRFVKPQYQAQATIWIDQSNRRGADPRGPTGPIRQGQLLEPDAWVDLLRSYMVLDHVVLDQRLFLAVPRPVDSAALATFGVAEHYRPGAYRVTVDSTGRSYILANEHGVELDRGVLGDSIGARLGFRWAPTAQVLGVGRTVRFSLATPRDGSRALQDALEVSADPEGNFLHLGLRGANPARVAAVANAVAQRYIEVAAELKRQKLTELRKILDEQLASARQNLSDAESALERFGVHTITLPSGRVPRGADPDQGPTVKGFFDLQLERDQAQRDRDALEQVVAQAHSGVSPTALEAIGAAQHSPDLTQALRELVTKQAELRTLRYQYTDAHPRVRRLVGEITALERQTIPALAGSLANELAGRAAELGRRIDAGSRKLREIPPQTIEEARLRRRVTLAETLYTTLQQRYEEARLAEASTIPDVSILDVAAAPQQPIKNTAPRLILVALVGSLGLACIGAVLLDRADPRVRYPEQVSRDMGLPILGALPHLKSRRNGGNGPGRTREDVAQLVEALRGVCLNVVHSYGTAGPMLITITSPGPGEGKSFLSANLAHSFAEGGQRTLLVDADIRRGVLHRRLAARRRPGLTDCLRGEVTFEAIVQETAYPLFTLIGCGTRVHNAPELLNSPAMARLMHRARSAYDVILVDSPPLAGGVDPFVLGTLTGNLLMVLRTGQSHREMAGAKLQMLRRLPVRLLGAVLNDVPANASYGYYSYYLPGYEAADEHLPGQAAVIS